MAAIKRRAEINYILDEQEEKNFGPLVLEAPSGRTVPCRQMFVEFVQKEPINIKEKSIEDELARLNLLPTGMHVSVVNSGCYVPRV